MLLISAGKTVEPMRGLDASWDPTRSRSHKLFQVVKYVQLPHGTPRSVQPDTAVWNSYAFGYADDADGGYGEVDSVRTPTGSLFQYRYLIEGGVRASGRDCREAILFASGRSLTMGSRISSGLIIPGQASLRIPTAV